MRTIRSIAPAAASLAFVIVLAACGPATGQSPSPSTPPASEEPTAEPSDTPTETPAEAPSEAPSPVVVEHELPMTGSATEDDIPVLEEPGTDAPVLIVEGEEIRLEEGEMVIATLGPLFLDGESWYEIRAVDGRDVHFEFGWVSGDLLTREGDAPETDPVVVTMHGQGTGGSVDTDVIVGTPTTVRFAAAPMPKEESCDIDVTLIRTDGTAVNVGTDTVTETEVFQLSANELSSLFQEEAGTVTLEVETDCSFAASLTVPRS